MKPVIRLRRPTAAALLALALIALSFASPGLTEDTSVALYGPYVYTRDTGKPEVVTDLFNASAEARDCRLLIHNGDGNGSSAGPSSGPSAGPPGVPSGAPSGGIEAPPAASQGNENDKEGENADIAGQEDPGKAEQKLAKLADKAAKQAEREAQKQAKAAGKNQVASAQASAAPEGKNGESDDKKQRVTSARVQLNDLEIFKPSDFSNKVTHLEAPVDLLPMNALSVELRGKPGSRFTLEVRCAGGEPRDNTPPVADAGMDQTAKVGDSVKLDGSGSSDMDSDPLTFLWGFQSVPPESNATLSDPTAVMPTFDVDRPGTYLVDLVVNDGMADSAPDTVAVSTENSPPSADAGMDQTIKVGDTVKLDGSGSSDVDGDQLTFAWSFLMTPAGSAAMPDDPTAVMPMFTADRPGEYVLQLVVNDGTADSAPDSVTISTENSAPVADAGTDETVMVGEMVTLDGSGSSDPDDDPITYVWSLTSVPPGSLAMLDDPAAEMPGFTADLPGMYVAQLVVNDGLLDSAPDTVKISTENSPPVADAGEDQMVLVGDTVMLSGLGSLDPDGDMITYAWSFTSAPMGSAAMLVDADMAMPSFTADEPGMYVVQLIVNDGLLDSAPDTVVAEATIIVPDDDSDNDGLTDAEEAELGTDPNNPDTDGDGLTDGAEVKVHGTNPKKADTDGDGYRDDVEINNGTSPLDGNEFPMGQGPPDPALVAPMPDMTVPSTLADAIAFLYTGPNPIQTGVAPETITLEKAAVLRGKVMNAAGNPLAAVDVSVLGHPELGQTQSRADGMYDLAVNGGTRLTVAFSRAGFLPAQRGFMVPQQDFVMAPDVALVQLDPVVTAVDLGAGGMQMARGGMVVDADGMRQATVMFPPGTTAEMVMPDGSTHAISNLSVRATEYTVGDMGPMMMPAALPPTSAYTYAVELSVDEAMAAGAAMVRFSQPLPTYVENFLGYPVGTPVPLGYYDRTKGLWVPSDDGRVIGIVGVTGGMADVDVDGDDVADTGAALAALGITDDERAELALLYAPGQSLWRSPVPHFSPWDKNWGFGPPPDALPPLVGDPPRAQQDESCEVPGGSVLECQNQVLGERFHVTGTPFSLNYRSNRVPGYLASRHLRIPVIGNILSPSLKRIEVDINIAGRNIQHVFGRGINITDTFAWDGLDAYGRMIPGTRTARMSLAYIYNGVPGFTSQPGRSFGATPEFNIEGSRTRQEISLRRSFKPRNLTTTDARGQGLGGWTLDVHHTYDTAAKILYLGDGRKRSAEGMSDIITHVAGMVDDRGFGMECCDYCDPATDQDCPSSCDPTCGDGKPATEAGLNGPGKIDFGPDGTLYIVDRFRSRIRQVTPDGVMTTFAGTGEGYRDPEDGHILPNGDGGPAILANVDSPLGIAAAPDGSVYIAEQFTKAVRKVDPNGIITTFAGRGTSDGSGIPATDIKFGIPGGMDVGPDGSLYVADVGRCLVWRISPDGLANLAAGFLETHCDFTGDGGPATQAEIGGLESLAVGDDGTLYLIDSQLYRVRAVTPDGIINTIAGTGVRATDYGEGDGGPAILANLDFSYDIATGPDGSVYIAETQGDRIRRVSPDGIITTVAGKDNTCAHGNENMPATAACTYFPEGVGVGPDGFVYLSNDDIVSVVRPVLTGLSTTDFAVASEDGTELYLFDATGRHLRTVNAFTGAIKYEFRYDAAGLLIEVEDGDGNVTTIERDGDGNAQAIVGPFGQRTELALDANGFLAGITNPASEAHGFAYTPEGLLTHHTNPANELTTYAYDDLGRLVETQDPAGGGTTFDRAEFQTGYRVSRTTALGRTSDYLVLSLPNGTRRNRNTSAGGLMVQSDQNPDGTVTTSFPDGSVRTSNRGPDPRFGMQTPVDGASLMLPGGLESTRSSERSADLTDPRDPLSLVSMTHMSTRNGKAFTSTFTASDRTIVNTSPEGRTRTRTMDALGRTTQYQIAGIEPSSASYDSQGRISSFTRGSGLEARTTAYAYGAMGFLETLTDGLGRVAHYDRDAAGRITSKTLSGAMVVTYGYDSRGNLTSLTPPGRPAHTFGYDATGRLSMVTPPSVPGSEPTTIDYNLDGQVTQISRPGNEIVAIGYDAAGRRDALTLMSGGALVANHAISYNPEGLVSSITGPGGQTLGFGYDGPLLTETVWDGPVSGTVSREFNADLGVMSESVNGTSQIAYGYDDDGILVAAGGFTLNRNAQNDLIQSTQLGVVSDTRGHNGFAELSSYSASANGSAVYAAAYTRDALGRLTEKQETVQGVAMTYGYSYDAMGRLTQVTRGGAIEESYTYDANGNRLTGSVSGAMQAGTYDDQDRILTYGAASFTHSPAGRMLTRTVGADTTAYDYDPAGNLLGVDLPDGTSITYQVDGANRRIARAVDGATSDRYLYSGRFLVAQVDGAGNVLSRFVNAGAGAPAFMIKGGNTYRIITDQVGSVRLVVDTASGAVAQRMDYDTFGNVTQDTSPGFQPFGYAGGLYDAATGLVRFGARDYDPSIGRWTAKDPVGFAGGSTNLYAYVRNRPTILRDPKGFDPEQCFEAEMCFEPEQTVEVTFEGVIIFDEGAHEGIGIILSDGSVIRFDKRCGSEGGFGGFGLACTIYGKNDISRREYPSIKDAYADGDVVHGPVDESITESVYNWLENEFENQGDGYYNLFNQSCQDLIDDALEQAGSDYPQGLGSWF